MVPLPALSAVLLLISVCQPVHVEAGLWNSQSEQSIFTAVPAHIASKGQGSLTKLQQQASSESFVNKLLGTDCFTKSLTIVNKDCRSLVSEKKSRLAMALAICHLQQLGQPAFTCKASMSLKQCADGIKNDRQYATYMEFLSNVDTMCLFLQSQDFQRHTEHMVNSLYRSAQHAAQQLNAVDGHLAQSLSTMHGMDVALTDVAAAQKEQLEVAMEGLEGMRLLHNDSQAVHAQLQYALQNEEIILTKQGQMLTNLATLDEEEAARAHAAAERWQEAQEVAADLVLKQQLLQQVQQQLLGDLTLLSDNSARLHTMLDVVVKYEQRGDAMLTHMLGNSYSVQDLLSYALAVLGIAALGLSTSTKGARLPLMVLFALSVLAERALMHSCHHLLTLDPAGQAILSLPLFGTTYNPKNLVRRTCLALAAAWLLRIIWKHTDAERETFKALQSIQASQQQQLKQQEATGSKLLELQTQQYIDFMAEMRTLHSPDTANIHIQTQDAAQHAKRAQQAHSRLKPSLQMTDADREQQQQLQLDSPMQLEAPAISTPHKSCVRRAELKDYEAEQAATTAMPSIEAVKIRKHKNAHNGAQPASHTKTAKSATTARPAACKPQYDVAEQFCHEPDGMHWQQIVPETSTSQQAEPTLAAEPATKHKNNSVEKPEGIAGAKKRQRAGHSSNAAPCEGTHVCQASSSHSKRPRSEMQQNLVNNS